MVLCTVCREEYDRDSQLDLYSLLRDVIGCSGCYIKSWCAACIAKDVQCQATTPSGAMKLWCLGRNHAVHDPPVLMHTLAGAGLIADDFVAKWFERRADIQAAMFLASERRATGVDDPESDLDLDAVEKPTYRPYRRCPACGVVCDKIDGCRHVVCSMCATDYMFCCLQVGQGCDCDSEDDGAVDSDS